VRARAGALDGARDGTARLAERGAMTGSMTVPIEHFRLVLRERRRTLLHQVDHITRLDEELEPEFEDSPAEFASETAGFAG
jgi:hypothetical protein